MDGEVSIGVSLNTKSFEKQIKKLEFDIEVLEEELDAIKKANPYENQAQDIKDYEDKIERLTNKLGKFREKQNELNKSGMSNIKQNLSDIGSETSNILTKVAKWGLAIFSVRSAYMFIRQSVSTLSQYDEQMAADIEYIRFAIANSLKPLIESIIQLVYKLLAYINYIAKAWFNVDLFANASAKSFKKVKSGIKGANSEAKKLQKTLLGFDEMNILQENGTTSKGGGGGGVSLPSTDLSKTLSDIEIPDWLDFIVKHKDIIIGVLEAVGIALVGIKYGLTGIKALGIGIALVSLIKLVKDTIELAKSPSWANFKNILQDLEGVLIGVGIAMVAFNATNPVGWIMLATAGLTKLIEVMGDSINKDQEKIKTTKSIKEAEENLYKTRSALNSATQGYKNATAEAKKAEEELAKVERNTKLSGQDLYNQVLTGKLTYDKMNKTQKKVYEAYLNNLEAQEKLKNATDKMTQATRDERQAQEDLSVSTFKYQGKFSDYVKTLIDGYNNGKLKAKEMAEGIMYVMSEMDKDTRKKFAESLPKNIKDGFYEAQKEAGYGIRVFSNGVEISFKEVANAGKTMTEQVGNNAKNLADSISKQFGTSIPKSIQKSIDKINEFTKKIDSLGRTGAVSISTTVKSAVGKGMKTGGILKLASGAVINQPGRGVPLRSDVRGGEAGREGVLPLTDQQAMAQLGYEIGKNVNITNYLNNYMDSRLMNRQMLKTKNEEEFGFNG